MKKQRQKALKDQKEAQKVQEAIDTAQQISAIITAVANVIQGWSSIPIVGSVLGAVAAAAMIASFVAAKSSAKSATAQFRDGGRLKGPSHEQGGIRGTGYFDDIEVEGDEFITRKSSARKHHELLEAINEDDFSGITQHNYTLKQILDAAGIIPAPETAQRVTDTHISVISMPTGKLEQQLSEMNKKLDTLQSIDRHTSNIPDEQYIQTDEGLIIKSKSGTKFFRK